MSRDVDLVQFGEKVERLCEFFLNQLPRDNSEVVKILHELRLDAQSIQDNKPTPLSFDGLDSHMRGHPSKET